jgi:hypothetical protein
MRMSALALGGIVALALSAAVATAAPAVPATASPQASNLVRIAGGCGWRMHRTRWGHCSTNRHAYYPRPYWRGYHRGYYGPRYYGGDGHEPWNRPSPTDHVANRLNRAQLRGGY